ncbi:MAG: M15 family metallopeptidase [Bacteroidia bacterium]
MCIRFVLLVLLALQISSCSGKPENKDTSIDKEIVQEAEEVQSRDYSVEYLLGKFNQKTDTSFAVIPMKYCSKEAMYLRKETIAAFIKMYDAAKKEGVNLKIISATRNFNEQKSIWEAKWNGSRLVNGKNLSQTIKDPVERAKTILRYSSMPGTSRHHWGTDMDLNSLENAYFTTAEGKRVYEWMKKNAAQFGFCQPYSVKNESRPNGYEEEKWHWSYTPLSSALLKEYSKKIKPENIAGFTGSETAAKLNIIENYVKGINPECR